jgi:lysophospholipase L1-like esterase
MRITSILLFISLICFTTFVDAQNDLCNKPFRIVILGSSTSYGTGAVPIDSSWVNKYRTYLKSKNAQSDVINLAVSGYNTYRVLCPTGFVPPAGRPAPDTLRNITKALSYHPNAIIINLPTNDVAAGYSLGEQKAWPTLQRFRCG